MSDEQMVQLLRDIRAGQQEDIVLYREVAQRALDAQTASFNLQRRTAKLYRIVVSVGAVLLAGFAYLSFR